MMIGTPRLPNEVLAAIALALLVPTVIFNRSVHQPAAIDGVLASAVARRSDTFPMVSAEIAYFEVGFPPEDWIFTIMLTDTARIQEARDIVSGVQTDRVNVMGTIIKYPAFYNPPWSYHLDPASIKFIQFAVEVCDAHPLYVEQHLQEACGAFLPGCVWCPFSSAVVAEVRPFKQFLPVLSNEGLGLHDFVGRCIH